MHRSGRVARVVDVVRVDPDEGRPRRAKGLGGLPGQEWMTLEVAVGPPVVRPAGLDQDGLAPERSALEDPWADGPAATGLPGDNHGVEVGKLLQRERREVRAVGEAVERRVEVGA